MLCEGCEERRKLLLEKAAAFNAAARDKAYKFLAASQNLMTSRSQDKPPEDTNKP